MCGLVYVRRKDGRPAAKNVYKRFKAQRGRGTEGFGYVAVEKDTVVRWVRSESEKEILSKLREETASEILFHHRTPTSTPNVEEAAHPLLIEEPSLLAHQYFVMHNGVIRNTKELREAHIKLGITYQTEMYQSLTTRQKTYPGDELRWNDTESLAVETALAIDGKKNTIDTEGSAAVIGFKMLDNKVVERFFYRNFGNPLYYYEDKVMISLASVGKGVLVDTMRLHSLNPDGGISNIEPIILSPAQTKPYEKHDWSQQKSLPAQLPIVHKMGFRSADMNDVADAEKGVHVKDIIGSIGTPDRSDDTYSDFILEMTDDTIWSEYDRVTGLIKETEQDIGHFESILEGGMVLSADHYIEKHALENKLERLNAYIEELETEIDDRAAEKRAITPSIQW